MGQLTDAPFYREAHRRTSTDLFEQWFEYLDRGRGSPGLHRVAANCSRVVLQDFFLAEAGFEPWPSCGSDVWLRTGPWAPVPQPRLRAAPPRWDGQINTWVNGGESVHHYSGMLRPHCGAYQTNDCSAGQYCQFSHASRSSRVKLAHGSLRSGRPWIAPRVSYDRHPPRVAGWFRKGIRPSFSHQMVRW